MSEITLRRLTPDDSFEEITALLHRAYKPLADAGMRFYASHQSPKETRERCLSGETWLALSKKIIGTITWRSGGPQETAAYYQKSDLAIFGQFAIEPDLQARGLGFQLLSKVEERAKHLGMKEIACDTAETALHLIRYYQRAGYQIVSGAQWKVTNYRSVILGKAL